MIEARRAMLYFTAKELSITTADKLHNLIPLCKDKLEETPDKDRRDMVEQIMKESKQNNAPITAQAKVKEPK
jgi:hypothetical protein